MEIANPAGKCPTCKQVIPGPTLALSAIHAAMGDSTFTVSQLLSSAFQAEMFWPGISRRDSVAKALGRHLLGVPGIQPAGQTRNKARMWRVDTAFLPSK